MMNDEKSRWKRVGPGRRTGLAVALVALVTIVQGCITAAVATAVIYVAGTTQYTAKVQVNASPDKVYAAMLRILDRRPDVTVEKRDDIKHKLEIAKGKNHATAQVELAGSGLAELKVTARENETDASHKELAMKIVQQVCDDLGVKYQVVEKM